MYILQNVFLKISDTVRVLSNFLLFSPFRYMHHTKSWPFLLTLMYMYMYMFMYTHAVTYRTGTSHAIVQFSTPKLCTTKIVSNLQRVCNLHAQRDHALFVWPTFAPRCDFKTRDPRYRSQGKQEAVGVLPTLNSSRLRFCWSRATLLSIAKIPTQCLD